MIKKYSKIKYWVPNEGLNDSSRGNCKNSNTGAKRVSERLLERKNAEIIMLVPNECLNDSSSGNAEVIIMPQSGV